MSYTFIFTKDKECWLKISTIEQLLDYWNEVFNPKLKDALDNIEDTKEFGRGMKHCDSIQSMIGFMAREEKLTYKEAYEKIVYDTRIAQYQVIDSGKAIYINKKLGWNNEFKEAEQFIHKQKFEFPVMKKEKLRIKKFPMGKHYYIFIDGVQLRQNENLKFNSYEEAEQFAEKYLKTS